MAGRTTGLLERGDRVTWRARHFGVPLELQVEVTEFDRPRHFRDEMLEGPFSGMSHDHYFNSRGGGTRMKDVFTYRSPPGRLGWFAERLVLDRYLENLLRRRNREVKRVAESERWRSYIP